MASEVDIVNLALAHLGDVANVASISPPDTSAQAGHCARFYPIARDTLLEQHNWGFATKRVSLALLSQTVSSWAYTYSGPSDVLNYIAIYDPNASDDWASNVQQQNTINGTASGQGVYTPQPFEVETDNTGADLIYTNQANAFLHYTGLITDTTKFSPNFVTALSFMLASFLAGPVIKGSDGRAVAKEMLGAFKLFMGEAKDSDANQRRVNPTQSVAWMVNR